METYSGKANMFIKLLMELLPNQPRSFDTADDPGFWTNGNEILCPTEMECEILAEFFKAENGEQDDNTGFYYIDFE